MARFKPTHKEQAKKFHVTLGNWIMQKYDARLVREEVFIVEQHIPVELEWDEMDAVCIHALAYDEAGQVIGTGRLLPDGHIGRMAVTKAARGNGIGGAMLQALMQQAQHRGDHVVVLSAQIHAEPFYRCHGFVRDGEEFMEAGIVHVVMRCRFD
jgi:predicted GNAT family N-acyltransferase